MHIKDAIYHAVHDYPGGPASLAPRMGHLSPATLQNMANPAMDSHEWSLKRFRQLLALTGDLRPLDALCGEQGGVFVPTSRLADAALPDLYRQVTTLAAEFGDVVREIETDVKDGRITPRELVRMEKQISELIEAAATLRQVVTRAAEPVRLQAVRG